MSDALYSPTGDVQLLDAKRLVDALWQHYGYDFREYATASLLRRLLLGAEKEGLTELSAYKERLLDDSQSMERLLTLMSINVSAMFRDPDFYRALRLQVIPLLRTWPFIRIWHAGCASGEEVYSMAILLEEASLYDRCRIYATDFSKTAVKRAQEGVFTAANIRDYTRNYQQSGGTEDFSRYYRADYDNIIIRRELKRNIVFAQHNLATDSSFNEFNLILCRNVMIYFNKDLQTRVLDLFHKSLCNFGILGLGKKETLGHTPFSDQYDVLADTERLYRRCR